jgi:hypothetical protein
MADDVEATARELKARGVEFVQDPKKADWGKSAIFEAGRQCVRAVHSEALRSNKERGKEGVSTN